MKVGIISDTHGVVDSWDEVYSKYLSYTDLIIHCGDVLYHGPRNPIVETYNPKLLVERINNISTPIVFAKGNCDAEVDQMVLNHPLQSPYTIMIISGRKILATHGHDIDYCERLSLAQRFNLDIMITGHTHIPDIYTEKGTIFLNPGSIALPKNDYPSFGMLSKDKIEILNLKTHKTVKSIDI
ncbi:phosphodiesterase [Proteinivorax hydrogeniformans]|uniref:Phosphoesterase n=1 Tax=Proteinivorax hydrogeniformans TaxID=1826727 RepID=A0AAU8HQY1_9FIRM